MRFLLGFFASFCSLNYEFLLVRLITSFNDAVVVWQSLTVGFFMAGIGLGVGLFPRFRGSWVSVELCLAALGAAIPLVIYGAYSWYRLYYLDHETDVAFRTLDGLSLVLQIFSLSLGVLSGFEACFVLRLAPYLSSRKYAWFHGVFYSGALGSSLFVALWGVLGYPWDLLGVLTAWINLGLGIVLWLVAKDLKLGKQQGGLLLCILPLFWIVGCSFWVPKAREGFLSKHK